MSDFDLYDGQTPQRGNTHTMTDATEMLTAREIAAILKCRPDSVYRLMTRAGIPEWRDGRLVRWAKSDVDSYLKRGWINTTRERRAQPEARPYDRAS